MITISEEVERLVRTQPYLEEALNKGIINVSALAREFRPEVEKKLMKPATESAIMMALKRLSEKQADHRVLPDIPQLSGDLTVRSNLVEITYANSDTLLENYRLFLDHSADLNASFVTVTKGVHETTILSSASLSDQLQAVLKSEHLKSQVENLSAITILLPENAIDIPGLHYTILKQLAWNGVNIIEEVSTYTEFTIVVKDEVVDLAFSILKRAS